MARRIRLTPRFSIFSLLAASLALSTACSADEDEGPTLLGGAGGTGATLGTGGNGFGATPSTGAAPSTGGSGGFNFGGQGGGGGGPVNPEECTAVEQQAEKRLGGEADIIWVIDNSGSMFDEAVGVQNNMNFFSGFIAGTGIDVRVVVISYLGIGPIPIAGPNGVCIGPPLGVPGACDVQPNTLDTNLPTYMHWVEEVGSNDALAKIQSTFQGWRTSLRPQATATFVVVTDDEAQATPSGQDFVNWVNSQPEFSGGLWRFSGIFCVPGIGGANCAADGNTYNWLVDNTGGVKSHVGSPDWTGVFQQLADAVVADAVPVDCEWVIPPPPPGEQLDPNKVNVQFTPTSGIPETIYGLDDATQCGDQGGWYYDDPNAPSRVIACQSSCDVMQADENAKVAVLFGCEREKLPR